MAVDGKDPKILGILNITRDSFSDGGRYLEPGAAIAHGRALVAQGADILDIGPASSHPDAEAVSAEEEIARLSAVLPALNETGAPLSVDSFQKETQAYALGEGVGYLNDIQGFPDADFYPRLADASCGLIVMHAIQDRGKAERRSHEAGAVLSHLYDFFDARVEALESAGISRARLILDPGMGFFLSDRPEVSFTVLSRLQDLKDRYGLPVLVSVSRKSFLRAVTGRGPGESGAATLAAELLAAGQGADFIRTHEPAPLKDALAVRRELLRAGGA